MLYYALADFSVFSDAEAEILRQNIKKHFSDKAGLKRKESVAAKALLCIILREKLGITDFTVDCDENGKPFATDGSFFFNLSHSGNFAICVCGDENVGCDIQEIKPFNEKVAKRFFTENEYAALLKSDDKARSFTRIWTLKESVLKFSGEGITGGLDRYDFSEYYEKGNFESESLRFLTFEIPGYVISFCFEKGELFKCEAEICNI